MVTVPLTDRIILVQAQFPFSRNTIAIRIEQALQWSEREDLICIFVIAICILKSMDTVHFCYILAVSNVKSGHIRNFVTSDV